MSYADAIAFAASLAATLLVSIVVFEAGDGTHGAMPADEFDGEESMVKLELDPWARGAAAPHSPGPDPHAGSGFFRCHGSAPARARPGPQPPAKR